jgi:hypothetical protein
MDVEIEPQHPTETPDGHFQFGTPDVRLRRILRYFQDRVAFEDIFSIKAEPQPLQNALRPMINTLQHLLQYWKSIGQGITQSLRT